MWWGNVQYYNWYPWERMPLFSFIVPIVIWSVALKGLALYRAARNEQKGWFIAMLFINVLGILEIIYLLFFSTAPKTKKKKS